MSATISYRLDLAVFLIDTTTGFHVSDPDVEFTFDRENVPKPIRRSDGMYILINHDRADMLMTVKARGYERMTVPIRYEELDERVPMKEVFLIPSENATNAGDYATIRGVLPNLTEVSFIQKGTVLAHIDAYDKRKKIMTVFEKGYRLSMEGSPYALVNTREMKYEWLDIVSQPQTNQVVLKEPIDENFMRNAPICRIMFGYVEPNGSYLIRVRDDRSDLRGLIRFKVDGEIRFKEVDFHDSSTWGIPEGNEA